MYLRILSGQASLRVQALSLTIRLLQWTWQTPWKLMVAEWHPQFILKVQHLVNIIPLALCTPLQLHSASFSSISSSGYIGCFDVVADGGFADLHRILDSKVQRLCCVVLPYLLWVCLQPWGILYKMPSKAYTLLHPLAIWFWPNIVSSPIWHNSLLLILLHTHFPPKLCMSSPSILCPVPRHNG